ncbi:hypothetical protein DP939_36590 [Spongiactinospora rosea]|uniref:Uncharacterized protein n=1 Tax=Spongiactinospora rosea TaxID=2248750 RepID=A0A366LMK2_9ACTN|nr:hypothetical protein [Spongiactinospora rosea]RBQ15136.1 hypothetical protein DP939_36590 [Spongiactinospora rosea]
MAAPLPPRTTGLSGRVPPSLDALRGPSSGVVELPPHLAWSGLTRFDLADRRLRMSMYRTVITGGGRRDAETYLNAGLLAADWPLLRMGLGPGYRNAWESMMRGLGPDG